MNPATEINKLWNKAMDDIDWDDKKGAHVLEISPDTLYCLRSNKFFYDHLDIDQDGKRYFLGNFLLKVIHQPIADNAMLTAEGQHPTKTEIPMWHFMALHVQRDNGRYRYIDWEGNDERCI